MKPFALTAFAAVATFSALAHTAFAADPWPSKPIKIVVPFPTGGSTDAIGCMLAAEFTRQFGQSITADAASTAPYATSIGQPPRRTRASVTTLSSPL